MESLCIFTGVILIKIMLNSTFFEPIPRVFREVFRSRHRSGVPPWRVLPSRGNPCFWGVAFKGGAAAAAWGRPQKGLVNHRKTMGKPWEKHGKMVIWFGIWWDLPSNMARKWTIDQWLSEIIKPPFRNRLDFPPAMWLISRGFPVALSC